VVVDTSSQSLRYYLVEFPRHNVDSRVIKVYSSIPGMMVLLLLSARLDHTLPYRQSPPTSQSTYHSAAAHDMLSLPTVPMQAYVSWLPMSDKPGELHQQQALKRLSTGLPRGARLDTCQQSSAHTRPGSISERFWWLLHPHDTVP
jgi:hypothetical protein